MEWFDDEEAVEEFDELYSIVTHIDEEDLSDLKKTCFQIWKTKKKIWTSDEKYFA